MGILVLIRHAKIVISDSGRRELDTVNEDSVAKIIEAFQDFKRQFVLAPADRVEVWTAPAAKTRLTGMAIGEVFNVQPNCTDCLQEKEHCSDKVRAMSEMLEFFKERLKEVKILIAVSHAPEVASFAYLHASGFAHSAREIDYQDSYYDNGKGVVVDFDAKTVSLF